MLFKHNFLFLLFLSTIHLQQQQQQATATKQPQPQPQQQQQEQQNNNNNNKESSEKEQVKLLLQRIKQLEEANQEIRDKETALAIAESIRQLPTTTTTTTTKLSQQQQQQQGRRRRSLIKQTTTTTTTTSNNSSNNGCGDCPAVTVTDFISFLSPCICAGGQVYVYAVANRDSNILSDGILEIPLLTILLGLDVGFEGTISEHIGQLNELRLVLIQEGLVGTVPTEIGTAKELSYLLLHRTRLEGTIPSEIGSLTALEMVAFTDSKAHNFPEGSIPVEFKSLTSMRWLMVTNGQLSGTIPSEMVAAMTGLLSLETQGNQLIGTLPSQLGENLILTNLEVHDNKLNGTLPSQLGKLTDLENLNVGGNNMVGSIPTEIGLLTNLLHFNISGNKFTGPLPSELSNLTKLSTLTLSDNNLNGPIPSILEANVNITCLNNEISSLTCHPDSEFVNNGTFVGLTVVSSLAFLVSLFSMVFVLWNRKAYVIKTATVVFSFVALVGPLFLAAAVPVFGWTLRSESSGRTTACQIYPILISTGSMTTLTALAVRHYRIVRIFVTNKTLNRVVIKDSVLIKIATALVSIDFVVIVTHAITSISGKPSYSSGCNHEATKALSTINFVFIATALITVAALALLIRNVPNEFNETRHINFGVFNIVTYSFAALVFFFTDARPVQAFVINSVLLIVTSLSVVLCIYGWKFLAIVRGSGLTRDTFRKETRKKSRKSASLNKDNSGSAGMANAKMLDEEVEMSRKET